MSLYFKLIYFLSNYSEPTKTIPHFAYSSLTFPFQFNLVNQMTNMFATLRL